ncbi:hypothetical protein ACFE04_016052 [Oxalis oulophora]
MSAQQLIAYNKEGASIFYEDAICRQKITELLVKSCLPNGLLPVKDVTEFGYNEATSFLWVRQKSKIDHKFSAINKTATFDQELSAFVEEHRMKKITGVKAKELMISITITEFSVDENNPDKLNFITSAGVKKIYPFSAFELHK